MDHFKQFFSLSLYNRSFGYKTHIVTQSETYKKCQFNVTHSVFRKT